MSASIRFLGFAVLAWAGVRAASLAFAPGSTSAAPSAQAAALRVGSRSMPIIASG